MAGATLMSCESIRVWAFDRTGEESLIGQARGLAQLGLDLLRPDPVYQSETLIPFSDVNPYGMNTFLHNEVEVAKREEILRLLSEAGFYWVREQFPWEDIEIHGRGDFIDRRNDPAGVDAWAKYDSIVDLVEAHGMELIVRLDNPPSWSRSRPDDLIGGFAPPDDYDDFANFSATVAERYRGRIHYYQIWNEPNIYPEWGEQFVSPENYTDLLCRTYEAIKAVDPEAVVLSGTLAPTSEVSGRDFNDFLFLQRMYDAGARDCFDVLTVQGYGLWSGPTDDRMRPVVINIARNQFIRDIMVSNGDAEKAIWISEMNWNAAPEDVAPVYGRVTLDQQARYAPRAYQRAEEEWNWVGAVCFWYFKRPEFSWLEERRPEAYFQMADPDFNLMPVYQAMKESISQPMPMYQGVHAANHWVIQYDQAWEVDFAYAGMSASSLNDGATARFTLSGSGLSLRSSGGDLRVRVDGGEWVSVSPDDLDTVVWRGKDGEHQVEIKADASTRIDSYTVMTEKNQFFINAFIGLVIAGVILSFLSPPKKPTGLLRGADRD